MKITNFWDFSSRIPVNMGYLSRKEMNDFEGSRSSRPVGLPVVPLKKVATKIKRK